MIIAIRQTRAHPGWQAFAVYDSLAEAKENLHVHGPGPVELIEGKAKSEGDCPKTWKTLASEKGSRRSRA